MLPQTQAPVAPAAIQPATFTRKTLAQYLQRSVPGIDRDIASGRLPKPFRLGGPVRGSIRWLRAEIDAWLAAGAPHGSEWEARKKATERAAR